MSSTGNGTVSLTIKGILIGLVPLVVAIARTYGYELPEEDITTVITQIFEIVSASIIVIGLARKIKLRVL